MGLSLVTAFAGLSVPPASAQQRPGPPVVQAGAEPKPAPIDRNGVMILIRSTLLALHAANQTGNYTVLRDMGAPGFQEANTAARLGDIFASHRAQKLDLSGVAVLEPQLILLPQIEPDGMMRMAGVFPSAPMQITFELLYAPVEGRWKPFGLAVSLDSTTPIAPAAAPARPPPPQPEQKPPPKPRTAPKT